MQLVQIYEASAKEALQKIFSDTFSIALACALFEMGSGLVYHEQQIGNLCGVHCLNNLLQAPCYTSAHLQNIAERLDNMEEAADFPNMQHGGNFNVQVLIAALQERAIELQWIGNPDMLHYLDSPESAAGAAGYVINSGGHWWALREVHGVWWDLNSNNHAPTRLGIEELFRIIQDCRARPDVYTIFGVLSRTNRQSRIPRQREVGRSLPKRALWWTVDQAMRAHDNRPDRQPPPDNCYQQESTHQPSTHFPMPEGYPGPQTPPGSQQNSFLPPRTKAASRYLKLLASVAD